MTLYQISTVLSPPARHPASLPHGDPSGGEMRLRLGDRVAAEMEDRGSKHACPLAGPAAAEGRADRTDAPRRADAHAAAGGQRNEALLGGARHHIIERGAVRGRGGDVEKAQLVGARAVVDLRLLYRIAGIDQIDEIDALDVAPVLDVEAGNDAHLQHGSAFEERQRLPEVEAPVVEGATADEAGDAVALVSLDRREIGEL